MGMKGARRPAGSTRPAKKPKVAGDITKYLTRPEQQVRAAAGRLVAVVVPTRPAPPATQSTVRRAAGPVLQQFMLARPCGTSHPRCGRCERLAQGAVSGIWLAGPGPQGTEHFRDWLKGRHSHTPLTLGT